MLITVATRRRSGGGEKGKRRKGRKEEREGKKQCASSDWYRLQTSLIVLKSQTAGVTTPASGSICSMFGGLCVHVHIK